MVAVLLARTAWEAFLNEYVQLRGLRREIRGASFHKSILLTHDSLDLDEPQFDKPPWRGLDLLTDLRNRLVHHLSTPYQRGVGPRGLLERLHEEGLPRVDPKSEKWERLVLVPWTARWACITASDAIRHLNNLVQPQREVEAVLAEVLVPLSEHLPSEYQSLSKGLP